MSRNLATMRWCPLPWLSKSHPVQPKRNKRDVAGRRTAMCITSAQWQIILRGKLENPRNSQKKHHPPGAPSSHPGFPLHWASHAAADPIAVGVPPHPPRWTSSMRTPWKSVKISRGSQRIAKAGWKVRWLRVRVRDLLQIFGILIAKLKLDWGYLGLLWAACPIAIRKHEQGQLLWDPLETLLTWTSNFLTHTTRCAVGISPTHWQLETGAQTRKMKPTEGVLLNHIKSIKANAGLMHIPSGKLT